jgi:hypothetical protein
MRHCAARRAAAKCLQCVERTAQGSGRLQMYSLCSCRSSWSRPRRQTPSGIRPVLPPSAARIKQCRDGEATNDGFRTMRGEARKTYMWALLGGNTELVQTLRVPDSDAQISHRRRAPRNTPERPDFSAAKRE